MCRVPVTQVAQAIQPYARRQPPVELRFGGGIDTCASGRDAAREGSIVKRCGDFLGHTRSIAIVCKDV